MNEEKSAYAACERCSLGFNLEINLGNLRLMTYALPLARGLLPLTAAYCRALVA
ncbi:hypothetical protein [uncultured Arcanobacterium sp.]|uniref:hypothetical protein n=1 Tax=uncultured Arcanobacterium sp. TaxID=487520 RepID=UPI0026135B62|nr:hypothetical protein [uncultured Arcanobacterium sp.]